MNRVSLQLVLAALLAMLGAALAPARHSAAQDPAAELPAKEPAAKESKEESPKQEERPRFTLIHGEPFDRITLKDGNAVRIVPQEFPEGKKPQSPKPTDKLRIVLLDEVGAKFDVAWKDIERYEQFQDMVLDDARVLTSLGRFDMAWDHLIYLRERYPNAPGLEEASQTFLYVNAGNLYQQGKLDRALAILEDLQQTNPDYPRAAMALGAVAGQVLKTYIEDQKNYRVARQLLKRLEEAYGAAIGSSLNAWRARLEQLATAEKNTAEAQVAAGNFLEAHEATRRMMNIWPELPGGVELAAEIAEKYPLVVVGVEQPAAVYDPHSIDNWAARRAGRLLYRMLTEYERHGPEGGFYRFPLGQYLRTDDDLQLRFRLNNDFLAGPIVLTGYDVARTLESLANPQDQLYRPGWGQLAGEIAVEGVASVVVALRQPHVRPEALLQTKFDFLAGDSEGNPFTPFRIAKSPRPNEAIYSRNDAYAFRGATQPAVVVERRFDEARQARTALLSGEIDVLDRIYPGDVVRLQSQSEVVVGRYDAPTVHMLVPNDKNPFLANRTFRRAVLLGIARDVILNNVLLEGANVPGCREVTGPFPAGVGTADPQAYAYDFRLESRAWNPQHAIVLKALAISQINKAAESQKAAPPKLAPLKLVYPAAEVARRACQAIQVQLRQIQIETQLVELPAGQSRPEDDDFDLLYVEASITEPLVDARRLLGEGGVAKITNPYIRQAVRNLDGARSWREARDHLLELHQRVHTELVVIPLWQLVEHYAYRNSVQNLTSRPALLYQDIEQWRIVPRPFTD